MYVQILLLDGKAQSAEADEFVYHELLVHPAMLLHPNPKSVFVAGGVIFSTICTLIGQLSGHISRICDEN